MANQIVIHVPASFVEEAKKTIADGDEYAQELFNILVEKYGANPQMIDMDCLREQGTGQIIKSIVDGREPTPPAELLKDRLRHYSPIGLAKHGLTQLQYDMLPGSEK